MKFGAPSSESELNLHVNKNIQYFYACQHTNPEITLPTSGDKEAAWSVIEFAIDA